MARTTTEQKPAGTVEQEATLARSQPSVTIKRDGKGVLSYEVKAYADDMIEALNEAVMAVRRLESYEANGAFDVKSPNGPASCGLSNLADKDDL
jgi:hypothetical protein